MLVTCLEMAKKHYSRPVDLHQIHTENGEATFPFSVECCNSTIPSPSLLKTLPINHSIPSVDNLYLSSTPLLPSIKLFILTWLLCLVAYLANSLCGVSDEQGGIRLLDTSITQETGITKEVISLKCHDNAVFDISWSADDYKLATASGDQTGKVFDIMSRECIAVFGGYHKTTLKKVEFKPDHNSIIPDSSSFPISCIHSKGILSLLQSPVPIITISTPFPIPIHLHPRQRSLIRLFVASLIPLFVNSVPSLTL